MATITVHIDDHTYEHALAMFSFLGLTAEEAVQELFKRASYDEKPVYTQLKPNKETLATMQECEDILNGKIEAKSYTDVDEMFRDILEGDEDDD